jgi:hypothetical protein
MRNRCKLYEFLRTFEGVCAITKAVFRLSTVVDEIGETVESNERKMSLGKNKHDSSDAVGTEKWKIVFAVERKNTRCSGSPGALSRRINTAVERCCTDVYLHTELLPKETPARSYFALIKRALGKRLIQRPRYVYSTLCFLSSV